MVASVTLSNGERSRSVTIGPEAATRFLEATGDPDELPTLEPPYPMVMPYRESDALERRANALIRRHEELAPLEDLSIAYLWRQKGKSYVARTMLATDLLAHYSRADIVIWLAADYAHEQALNDRGIEALLYRQLCYIEVDEEKKGFKLRKPDFVGFFQEIERYGLYSEDLRDLKRVFQEHLPGFEGRLP
jgi:hypothetical protein